MTGPAHRWEPERRQKVEHEGKAMHQQSGAGVKDGAIEAAAAAASGIGSGAGKVAVGGGVVAVVDSLFSQTAAIGWIGAVVAVLSLLLQWYYKRREDARAERAAALAERVQRATLRELGAATEPGELR